MKLKRLLCLASLMMMVFLVGCKKEEKLDIADLQYDWQFVEMEVEGQVTPHTPGFESNEPSVAFSDNTITFSISGKNTYYGVVGVAKDCYTIDYPDDSAKPMVAMLSDGGNTLTISIAFQEIHFIFKKQ